MNWKCFWALVAIAIGLSGSAACIAYVGGNVFVALIATPLAVFLVALLIGLKQLKHCFNRPSPIPTDQDSPSVTIQDIGPLLLYKETVTSGSPILNLNGIGTPSGGSYQWSIINGRGKIQIVSELNQPSIAIKPVVKSGSIGDIVLKLTYTSSEGTASTEVALTVYTPSSAIQISTHTNAFNGPDEYGYDFTVRNRILDQFGERFPEGYLSLTEDLSVILNPYNTQFEEREYISDANAEYDDHYTLIFNNQHVPIDYIAMVRQVVKAQGVIILDHILVWKTTHVDFE